MNVREPVDGTPIIPYLPVVRRRPEGRARGRVKAFTLIELLVPRTRISKARSGFTLIELLVVVAIISILAGMLFPVFAQSRDKARSAGCLSNLKQIGTAARLYTIDHDEMWPTQQRDDVPVNDPAKGTAYPCCGLGNRTEQNYVDELAPYLKSTQVWRCPSARTSPFAMFRQGMELGYHMNATFLMAQPCQYGQCRGVSDSAVADAANTLIAREADGGILLDRARLRPYGSVTGTGGFASAAWAKDDCQKFLSSMVHNNGLNLLLADGHAKWYPACATRSVSHRPSGLVDPNPCFGNFCQ